MRFLRYILVLAFSAFLLSGVSAQTQYIGGVINNYVKVTAFDCAANQVTVTSPAGFAVGDTVLLIQMKGAVIDQSNSASYGDITDTLTSGNYEICIIANIVGNDIIFQYQVIRDYNPAGAVQLVRMPYYPNDAHASSASGFGDLTAAPWDPVAETGGVLAFTVGNQFRLTNRNISMVGTGFDGGADIELAQACGFGTPPADYAYSLASLNGAPKGEGITDYPATLYCGRGKLANGGGGGNDHNTGGGGGGNGGSGGIGGVRIRSGGFSTCRGEDPGLGGTNLVYDNSANKIWMGGGGGAGHVANSTLGSPDGGAGGRGAGIVLIRTPEFRNNSGRLFRCFGENGPLAGGDGAGGGGAGGTILVETNTFINAAALGVQINGGRGGNQNWSGANNQCMGTGGGGGGGVFWHSGATLPGPGIVTFTLSGGVAGVQQGICAADGSVGALPGQDGVVLNNLVIPQSFTPPNGCVLPVMFSQIRAKQKGGQVEILWSTASEINNDYFSIERSIDGEHFSEIARHPGHVNTDNFSNYTIMDEEPHFGVNYYRVRQVDYNGASTVSGAQRVKFHVDHQLDLQIYPNPLEAGENLNATFVMPYAGYIRMRLMDAYGRTLMDQSGDVEKGLVILDIPIAESLSGIYFLKINTQDFSEVKRISVLKK